MTRRARDGDSNICIHADCHILGFPLTGIRDFFPGWPGLTPEGFKEFPAFVPWTQGLFPGAGATRLANGLPREGGPVDLPLGGVCGPAPKGFEGGFEAPLGLLGPVFPKFSRALGVPRLAQGALPQGPGFRAPNPGGISEPRGSTTKAPGVVKVPVNPREVKNPGGGSGPGCCPRGGKGSGFPRPG